MRLIDVDIYKAIWNAKCVTDCSCCSFFDKEGMCHLIDKVPTVDAVVVVQCKDCRYRDGTPGQPNIICGNMKDDDFCSHECWKEDTNES